MIIQYSTSVYTPAGWRNVNITAEAAPSESGKMATVLRVIAIDDVLRTLPHDEPDGRETPAVPRDRHRRARSRQAQAAICVPDC
jgi:hypothetical protein